MAQPDEQLQDGVSLDQMIEGLRSQRLILESMFPRLVSLRKMTQSAADQRLAEFAAIEALLRDERGRLAKTRNRNASQGIVGGWVLRTWGRECLMNLPERAARVLEEAAELAQAEQLHVELAHRIVDHVYSRPVGNAPQEAAGVAVTLLAWAAARDISLDDLERLEVDRVTSLPLEHFRRKHDEKAAAGIMPTRLAEAVAP